jgi:hypothetical protein
MRGTRTLIVCAVVGWIGLAADVSEAALAKKLGGSGFSGHLSSNKAIRKQQLICDPDEPTDGSTSVQYDPNIVSLSGLIFGPGYTGRAVVEVRNGEALQLQDVNSFLKSPAGIQTGYAQIFYTDGTQGGGGVQVQRLAAAAPPLHGQLTQPKNYLTVDDKGPLGVDTNALFFNYLRTVPDSAVAVYTIYADAGGRPSGNSADFLTGVDPRTGVYTVGAGEIAPVTVRGSLNAVPLPAAAVTGGLTLAGLALALRFRKVAA